MEGVILEVDSGRWACVVTKGCMMGVQIYVYIRAI